MVGNMVGVGGPTIRSGCLPISGYGLLPAGSGYMPFRVESLCILVSGQCYNVLFELGVLCDPVQGAALDEEDAGEAR
jgi:hypothetical protein